MDAARRASYPLVAAHPQPPPPAAPPPRHYFAPPQPVPVDHQPPAPPPPSYAPGPVATGSHLPPIQHPPPYAPPPGAPADPQDHSPFRHPPPPNAPHPQEPQQPPRESPKRESIHEYHPYPPASGFPPSDSSGHATPTPMNGSFTFDSLQRTPTEPGAPLLIAVANGAPGPGPAQQMEHAVYYGYAPNNGAMHPGMSSAPAVHPPASTQQHHSGTVVEEPHGYGHPPSTYSAQPLPHHGPASAFATQSANSKRTGKQMRATQACENCRKRKQKCDERNPCYFCRDNDMACTYKDTPPVKVDKNMERILQYMESFTATFEELKRKIDNFDQRLERVETKDAPQPVSRADSNGRAHGNIGVRHGPSLRDESAVSDVAMMAELPPAKVPEEHRTGPHKLLQSWPSLRKVLNAAHIKIHDGYVAQAEDRPILRLWTRGEGDDEHDGTRAGGHASPTYSDNSSDSRTALPADGLWQSSQSHNRRGDRSGSGTLQSDGSLDVDVATLNQLYDSYMKHIHVMHPFLDKGRLRKLFDSFVRRYGTSYPGAQPKVTGGDMSDSERPAKRHRSNGWGTAGVSSQEGEDTANASRSEVQPERSPSNAVIWLVLALGKICLHKESLPSIASDGGPLTNSVVAHQMSTSAGFSPAAPAAKVSPISPRSTPMTHPTPSSTDARSSSDGVRNIDVIPGLAYYANAVPAMGSQADGNDLIHAQMFLLAGLYKGQLARVKESMSWISMAGRTLINLLERYKLYKNPGWAVHGGRESDDKLRQQHELSQARIKDKRHSLIVLASWTALQLESDILAELRFPSSGIQAMEEVMLMPHNLPEDESDNYSRLEPEQDYDVILIYYTSQLFLRRRLNKVHRELYGEYAVDKSVAEMCDTLLEHDMMLDVWRRTLPMQLQWDDDDPPPAEILPARLRGKYWGARYVINRPFLDYCLHILDRVKEGHSVESAALDVNGNARTYAEVQLFKAIRTIPEANIWHRARRCIDAAMHSTVAFDGIAGRLWVTNIHGTAHAQFGNMLVLSACCHHPVLRDLIDEDRFARLLQRTIAFLRRYADSSRTCWHDTHILEAIQKLLFPLATQAEGSVVYQNEGYIPSSASTSFPSTAGPWDAGS